MIVLRCALVVELEPKPFRVGGFVCCCQGLDLRRILYSDKTGTLTEAARPRPLWSGQGGARHHPDPFL